MGLLKNFLKSSNKILQHKSNKRGNVPEFVIRVMLEWNVSICSSVPYYLLVSKFYSCIQLVSRISSIDCTVVLNLVVEVHVDSIDRVDKFRFSRKSSTAVDKFRFSRSARL